MTKKSIVLLTIATCCLLTFAQSQEGIVRTSGTAKKKGSPISGVILRPLGGNDVMSGDDGRFSMHLRQQLEEGDYFLFSRVFKKGYEPIDKDILKRRFVYSQTVPIEIVLISSEQLMKTKADIEEKARKKAERRYRKQKSDLEAQLAAQRINAAEYRKQVQMLERQMQKFEVLIAAMSDHYARTDYNKLDSLNAVINECIINGELEKADSLINTKGDVKKRANDNIVKGKRLKLAELFLDSLSNKNQ